MRRVIVVPLGCPLTVPTDAKMVRLWRMPLVEQFTPQRIEDRARIPFPLTQFSFFDRGSLGRFEWFAFGCASAKNQGSASTPTPG